MTQPLRNEKMPVNPIWAVPKPDGFPIKVGNKPGVVETWITVANDYKMNPVELMKYNFGTTNTDEVNWFLRTYVGCKVSTDGGQNWSFKDANPGVIYVPNWQMEGSTITAKPGINGKVNAPEYDDSDFYDLIGKALDIQGLVDMNLSIWDVALPELLEAGLIAVSAAASVIAPLAAVGAGWHDALRAVSREYFFDGFTIGLFLTVDGASPGYIESRYKKFDRIFSPIFPEKGMTFRNLYNVGLLLGIKQGKRFNTVDTMDLFGYINSQLKDWEQEYYSDGDARKWSPQKRRDFQERAASIIKNKMLEKNLQLKFR